MKIRVQVIWIVRRLLMVAILLLPSAAFADWTYHGPGTWNLVPSKPRMFSASVQYTDDSLNLIYAMNNHKWHLQFSFNDKNENLLRNKSYRPEFFVRERAGLGRGRYNTDYVMSHESAVLTYKNLARTQYIVMPITRKDVQAIEAGHEIGVSYFMFDGTKTPPWRTYLFSNKGLKEAISRIQAAIASTAVPAKRQVPRAGKSRIKAKLDRKRTRTNSDLSRPSKVDREVAELRRFNPAAHRVCRDFSRGCTRRNIVSIVRALEALTDKLSGGQLVVNKLDTKNGMYSFNYRGNGAVLAELKVTGNAVDQYLKKQIAAFRRQSATNADKLIAGFSFARCARPRIPKSMSKQQGYRFFETKGKRYNRCLKGIKRANWNKFGRVVKSVGGTLSRRGEKYSWNYRESCNCGPALKRLVKQIKKETRAVRGKSVRFRNALIQAVDNYTYQRNKRRVRRKANRGNSRYKRPLGNGPNLIRVPRAPLYVSPGYD